MANMTNSLGTFFWLSFIFIFIKTKVTLPYYADILFLLLIMLFMYFINVNIMYENCGAVNTWSVISSTIFPWTFIFGIMMVGLNVFPAWKTPFSNTFGLLIARFAGCNTAFLQMLKPQTDVSAKLQYVYQDPSLLVNRFTVKNFDETIQTISEIMVGTLLVDEFKKYIILKELISEWIWYLLTASIVISISYNSIMSGNCTKTKAQYVDNHNLAMAKTVDDSEPTVYTVTE
jgi:hypothetical protein